MKTDEFLNQVIVPQYINNLGRLPESYYWYKGVRSDNTQSVFKFLIAPDPEWFKTFVDREDFIELFGPTSTRTKALTLG